MQSSYALSITEITPARGLLLCEAQEDRYETESGLIAIWSVKRNPKLYRGRVIAIGGPFKVHGHSCQRCEPVCTKKQQDGRYWARPGDIVWMKRGFKKQVFQGKTYLFVPNEDVLTTWREE